MKTKRKTKKTVRKSKKGGVLLFQTAPQDIMPELHRFANGKVQVVGDGRYGVILRLSADESTLLKTTTCGVKHILVKVVAIDKDARYKKYEMEKISVLEFEEEVHIHQDVCEASIKKLSCSIAPTLLYAQIYTLPELQQFPSISKHINTTGRVGLIFMEMIETYTDDYPAFNLLEYYKMPQNKDGIIKEMFPKARRLLIMLAQLGFLHNDFHLRNLVCPFPLLYIIDFGRASRMTEKEKDEFNGYVEANDIEKIITFLYGEIKYYINKNPTGFLYYQWLNQPQIDTLVPGIDLSIEIASEESLVAPIKIAQDQHALCVFPPKMPYREIEESDRRKRLADKTAAAKEKLANETPEEKTLREEQELEKLRRLDPNYYPYGS